MPEPKPAVTIAPAVTMKTLSPQTTANATTVSPTGSLARVPIPPSFTMQSPDIASNVPQLAVPRYRPQRRTDEGPSHAKIARSAQHAQQTAEKFGQHHTCNSIWRHPAVAMELLQHDGRYAQPISSSHRFCPTTTSWTYGILWPVGPKCRSLGPLRSIK